MMLRQTINLDSLITETQLAKLGFFCEIPWTQIADELLQKCDFPQFGEPVYCRQQFEVIFAELMTFGV